MLGEFESFYDLGHIDKNDKITYNVSECKENENGGAEMKKRMLENHTALYQAMPRWLVVLITSLLALGIPIVSSLAVGIVLGVVAAVIGIGTGNFDILIWLQTILTQIHVQLGLFIFTALLLFAWVVWMEKRPISTLGFFKGHIWLELLKGWGLGTLLLLLSFGAIYLAGGLTFVRLDLSLGTLLFILSLVPFWFLQGGTEELLTRGWLLPILANKTNLAFALALSSSLFGLMHLANSNVTLLSILSIILSGVMMALYMLKTDNIWGVAGLHGAWNFTQGNIVGVAVSGQGAGDSLLQFETSAGASDWLSGGAFGIEGSLLTCLVLLAAIVVLRLQLKKEDLD